MKPKILFQPIKPFIMNQEFGANRVCISTDGKKTIKSCDGKNPPEGYKSLYGPKGHGGIDLRAEHGQEVYCAQEGIVYRIDTDPRSGLDVGVQSYVNGIQFRHIYEHLMGYQPQVGDKVSVGQLIGWADNTGYSSGDHLHFQFEVFDGKAWVKTDPMPYMDTMFAQDALKRLNTIKYLREQLAKILDNWAYSIRKK